MSQDPRSRQPARSRIRPACEPLESRALLSRTLPSVSVFVTAQSQVFLQQSGEALITLSRDSYSAQGPLSVEFRTSPPANPVSVAGKASAVAATAGEHYLPVDEIVTFQPGQTSLTVSVPIVREAANPGVVLVGISAKPLVANGSAVTGEIAIASDPDQLPLAINDARVVREASGASAVTMTFNQPMARATVENLGTYRIERAGRPVPLKSATYDAATDTVTLVTKSPYNPARVYKVTIGSNPRPPRRGRPAPGNVVIPTSQTGNPLSFPEPLPGKPGTTPIVLTNKFIKGYVASPTTYKVSGRSSGPPDLNPSLVPININYPLGYILPRLLIPI